LTTSLLRSVIETGTARAARSLGREAAGKTGTTNDVKDAWFVGYTTDFVAGVWIGYDDTILLGPSESGAKTALPSWIEFMKAAHEDRPKTRFSRTPGVLTVAIDPRTGLLPPPSVPSVVEEFLAGTEPTEVSSLPLEGLELGEAGNSEPNGISNAEDEPEGDPDRAASPTPEDSPSDDVPAKPEPPRAELPPF
jgi:penicillin-binding protein 1A